MKTQIQWLRRKLTTWPPKIHNTFKSSADACAADINSKATFVLQEANCQSNSAMHVGLTLRKTIPLIALQIRTPAISNLYVRQWEKAAISPQKGKRAATTKAKPRSLSGDISCSMSVPNNRGWIIRPVEYESETNQ